MTESARVTPWRSVEPVSEPDLRAIMDREGLTPYAWSNGPGDTYVAHTYTYNKVIYVVRGAIEFMLPETDRRLAMRAGDRLDLPAGVLHAAVVGPDGVLCLEAHL